MIEIRNKGKINDYVYDISLDGTVVNALGLNIASNTDGFNFKLPNENVFRYTKEHPYISTGESRETQKGKEYSGFKGDLAEFNDMYMKDFHYSPNAVNKMGLGLDEVVSSTINFSRKNYADYFPENPYPEDVKRVGNTIKSKKMPEYIAKFLDKGIRHLLRGDGQLFLNEYYSYIEKIYNYQIPLMDIASKGKIKKSLDEYKKDVQVLTKAGRPKSRQAWYELAIKNGITVNPGDTIYYINVGKSKSHSDIKKITKYYQYNELGEKVDITKEVEKQWKRVTTAIKQTFDDNKMKWVEQTFEGCFKAEEIVFNSELVPLDIIDKEEETFCSDVSEDMEYNVSKYIDMFNKRIKPLLVCFNKNIREQILIENPENRPYFTEEQCQLVSGEPNKISDQDTYKQLMTMEDKEIKFWKTNNLVPPFIKECGMGEWEDILSDYNKRMEEELRNGIAKEKEEFANIISKLTKEEVEEFIEEGTVPFLIMKIADIDPLSTKFISKTHNVPIGDICDIYELVDNNIDTID